MKRFERVLFIRLSAVGDVINTLPALSALRRGFPEAFIGFAVEDRAVDLIAGHPCVNRVHLFPRRRWVRMLKNPFNWGRLAREVLSFLHDLRAQHYQVALELQTNLKGALHALASGAPHRIGFGKGHTREFNHLLMHTCVTPPTRILNRVDKFLWLVSAIGAPVDNPTYQLPDSPASRTRADQFLASVGLQPGQYIVLHPGTSEFGQAKRWMPERFAELASRIGRMHAVRCVITWGPGENTLTHQIAASSAGFAIPAMETPSLLDLAEILRRAKLFVGCDSGPLHLASAVGVPRVALFGPKDPRIYGPYQGVSRIVSNPNGQSSMTEITVDDVCLTVQDLLRSHA